MEQLRDALVQTFNKKVEEGKVQEILDKAIENFVKETASHICSSYGDFAKAFEKRVTEDLVAKISTLSLEQYNDIIIGEIRSRMDGLYLKSAKEHLEKTLDEFFQKPKESYKLSEIVKMIREDHEDAAREDQCEYMSLHVDDKYSLQFIYIDPEQDKQEYSCKYRLTVDKDGMLLSAHKHESSSYGSGKKYKAIQATDAKHSKLDALFFQAIAWGVKIDVDKDRAESETHYPWRD